MPEKWRELIQRHRNRQRRRTSGALWRLARLLSRLDTYLEKFGRSILHGEAEYDTNGLIRLAGWSGEILEEEARELRFALARVGDDDRKGLRSYVERYSAGG